MKRIISVLMSIAILSGVFVISSSAEGCTAHSGERVVKPASFTENGSISQVCKNCGTVIATSPIEKLDAVLLYEDCLDYNGKARTPKIYATDASGILLNKGADFTVSYSTNRKSLGNHKLTITFKGNYSGKKTLSYSIKPKGTEISGVTVLGGNSLKLGFKKCKNIVSGYKIQYSTNKSFKKSKTATIKKSNTSTYTLKNLKTNGKYYIRIRTYKPAGKKNYYSSWTDTVTVKLTKNINSVKSLINTATLTPMKTNNKELDNLVKKLFNKIHTSKMSNYDKLRACYKYLVDKMKYEPPLIMPSSTSYTSYYDSTIVNYALNALSTKRGVCDTYSAAFVVMARRLGFEAYLVGGTVSKKGGGRTGHAWVHITLNSKTYIFDPQVQSNNKNLPYYYFGKTYSQMGKTYDLDKNGSYQEKYFRNFECSAAIKMNMTSEIAINGKESNHILNDSQNGRTSLTTINFSPTKAFENNVINLSFKVSGGSGKYELLIIDSATKAILCDKIFKNSHKVNLDLSRFSKDTTSIDIVIYDKKSYASYIANTGIKLQKNNA